MKSNTLTNNKRILVIHCGTSYLSQLLKYVEDSGFAFEELNFDEVTRKLQREMGEGEGTKIELGLGGITPGKYHAVVYAGGVIRGSVVPGLYGAIKRWSRRFIRELNVPFLGICLGHMMLGFAYGATYRVMKRRALNPMAEEKGVVRVTFYRRFPLAPGISHLDVYEDHERELARLPDCLINTASSINSEIQAIYHVSKPQFGVQFHPERKGRVVLDNFFNLLRRSDFR